MIKYLSQKLVKAVAIVALAGLSGVADAQAPNWSQAGPIYNAGRSRNMIVDKNDPSGQTLYVGSSSSGVFKSTDAGVTWNALALSNNQLNVSYIAQAIDGKIYVATGEGFLRPGQKLKALPGTGLYVINGNALQLVPGASSSVVGTVINRVACSPVNANVIALATNVGIMTSNDGGNNFNLVSTITGTNISGQDVKFDSNGVLYCSIGCENTTSPVASKVYKSQDFAISAATSYSVLGDLKSPLLQDSIFGRIELAIAPSNNNIIYAACANKYSTVANASLKGLFVSYDGGGSWGLILQGSAQLDPFTNGGTLASGDYASVVTVSPFDPNHIYVGSYQFYTWTRTGGPDANPVGTWIKPSITFNAFPQLFIAPNIHDIKLIKSGNSIAYYYFVTDAGIFRSADNLTSFQPFYKGLITGQFNSVSIQRFPLSSGNSSSPNGTQVIPYSGFIGGTGGNGLNYFSGAFPLVTKEVNYESGDVYQSEFSKILPNAAYFTEGTGKLFKTSDVTSSAPVQVDLLASAKTQSILPFDNTTYNVTGTPFKMWENYGQVNSPDSVLFYNDTLRFAQSMIGVSTLTTQTTFTFSAARPNKNAIIDSIVVRTGTVLLAIAPPNSNSPGFTGSDKKDITIAMQHGNSPPPTGTYTAPIGNQTGPVVTSSTSVVLNANTLLDNISVTFSTPPFQSKTTVSLTGVPDAAAYYRVFATVFYKYKIGDSVQVVDDRISTKTYTYSAALSDSLDWRYGSSQPAYTLAAANASAITNPTFVLNPGNVTQTFSPFTVRPITTTNYTISAMGTFTFGTYTVTGRPVTHTLVATSVPNSTYVLTPGSITQTVSTFTVAPTATTSTIYTITTTNTSATTTAVFTVAPSTYSLEPGTVTHLGNPVFTIVATPTNPASTYSITGLSSNTLTANDTYTTGFITTTTFSNNIGYFLAAVPPRNKPVKIACANSARLAVAYGANVYVSNAPLSLNNPISLINVSSNKCLTTDNNGNKLSGPSNTVAISGTVTAMEWSKSGTELYYATNDPISGNKALYRVSYLDALLDSTAKSYSGKLHTNVFTYSNTVAPDGSRNNPRSPYRTTVLGLFGRPITGISVTKDDKAIAVTFDNPTGTKMIYSTVADVRKCDSTNVVFMAKDGTGTTAIPQSKVYCSLMELSDNKKVFIGTDIGVYYTNDITANPPTWADGNNNQLPVIQVFDLKQQTMRPWECYNPGVILAATNGRGVWVNKDYQLPYFVGVKEEAIIKKDNNLSLYPNPTNGTVFVSFNTVSGENASVVIMDINGKIVQKESIGKLNAGQLNFSFETSELASGMYIVSINSDSGIKRVAKLVVTK